jgi:hypothetical protein
MLKEVLLVKFKNGDSDKLLKYLSIYRVINGIRFGVSQAEESQLANMNFTGHKMV